MLIPVSNHRDFFYVGLWIRNAFKISGLRSAKSEYFDFKLVIAETAKSGQPEEHLATKSI